MSAPSATQIAFLLIAVSQAVFGLLWAGGAWWVRASRRAIAHWAIWSALSAATWLILAFNFNSPPLAGVLAGVIGAIALQRGIRLFIGRPSGNGLQIALCVVVIAASTLPASSRYLEATTNFAVLAWLYFDIGRDLYRHARDDLRMRLAALLPLPVFLGALGYGSRSLRALLQPESVLAEMAVDSVLNVGGALVYMVLLLTLHSVLVTLVVARLVSELRKLSLHDALTGLLNRRAMEEALQAHVRSSRRSGAAFVVMMLDLDYFKRINDDFGHAIGDLALQHVSRLLRDALRDGDRLARYGGEEFVVLLPNTSRQGAQPVAEKLRALLSSHPLIHRGDSIALSVSIGLTEWRGADDEMPSLLERADAALFQAKVQGRNRVVAESLPEPALAG